MGQKISIQVAENANNANMDQDAEGAWQRFSTGILEEGLWQATGNMLLTQRKFGAGNEQNENRFSVS